MTDILEMNQGIFGSSFKTTGVSRRARKAMSTPLIQSDCVHEMTYDDCEDTDGGGFFLGMLMATVKLTRLAGTVCFAATLLHDLGFVSLSNTTYNICKGISIGASIVSCFGLIGNMSTLTTKAIAALLKVDIDIVNLVVGAGMIYLKSVYYQGR